MQKELDPDSKFAAQFLDKFKMAPAELCSRCDFNTLYLTKGSNNSKSYEVP